MVRLRTILVFVPIRPILWSGHLVQAPVRRHLTPALSPERPERRGRRLGAAYVGSVGVGDFRLRAGDAAGDDWEFAFIEGASRLNIATKLVQARAQLQGGAEQEFGAHAFEVLFLQSTFHTGETGGKLLQFFFEGRDVFLLELFDLQRFYDLDGAARDSVRLPIKECRLGDLELVGDPAEAPAVGAHDEESVFGFSWVHNSAFLFGRIAGEVGQRL